MMEKLNPYPKILFWNWTDPSTPSGSPRILVEILEEIPEGKALMICQSTQKKRRTEDNIRHPVKRYRLGKWIWPFSRGSKLIHVARWLGLPGLLIYGIYNMARFRPECIFTVYKDPIWILTSFLLSKLTKVPVVYHLHDPYLETAESIGGLGRRLARWLEPRTMKHGYPIALNKAAQINNVRKYSVESPIVPNFLPAELRDIKPKSSPESPPFIIGFCGTIYDNNASLISQLADAINQFSNVKLIAWTNVTAERFAELGFNLSQVEVRFEENHQKLLEALGECHVMYLPMSFEGTKELPSESLALCLPTKTVDYLIARRPILVHAPAHYAVSEFINEYNAGHLLTESDSNALSKWFEDWISGKLPKIEESAMHEALQFFDRDLNSSKLCKYLNEVVIKKDEK